MNKQKIIALAKKVYEARITDVAVVSIFSLIAVTLFFGRLVGKDWASAVATLAAIPAVCNVCYELYMLIKPSTATTSAIPLAQREEREMSEWEKLVWRLGRRK